MLNHNLFRFHRWLTQHTLAHFNCPGCKMMVDILSSRRGQFASVAPPQIKGLCHHRASVLLPQHPLPEATDQVYAQRPWINYCSNLPNEPAVPPPFKRGLWCCTLNTEERHSRCTHQPWHQSTHSPFVLKADALYSITKNPLQKKWRYAFFLTGILVKKIYVLNVQPPS